MRIIIYLTCACLLLGLVGCASPPAPAPDPQPRILAMATLAKGDHGGLRERRLVAVRDAAQWQELANQAGPVLQGLVMPDFQAQTVLALFMGQQPTGGYAIQAVDARSYSDRVVVRFQETKPPQGAMVTNAFSEPYHLTAIPRTDLPVEFHQLP